MTSSVQASPRSLAPAHGRAAFVRQRLLDHAELTKPRIVAMVLVATLVGYYLGSAGRPRLAAMLHTLVGTALAAAGTLTLNQVMEVDGAARCPTADSRWRTLSPSARRFSQPVLRGSRSARTC